MKHCWVWCSAFAPHLKKTPRKTRKRRKELFSIGHEEKEYRKISAYHESQALRLEVGSRSIWLLRQRAVTDLEVTPQCIPAEHLHAGCFSHSDYIALCNSDWRIDFITSWPLASYTNWMRTKPYSTSVPIARSISVTCFCSYICASQTTFQIVTIHSCIHVYAYNIYIYAISIYIYNWYILYVNILIYVNVQGSVKIFSSFHNINLD